MDTQQFTSTATGYITSFGTAAHQAIGAYREGGERLAQTAQQRWDAALEEAAPKLKPETRKNATNAQKVFGRYYTRGLAASAGGATVVVDTLVGAAIAGVERAAALREQYAARNS
jgi:hypothetical protein